MAPRGPAGLDRYRYAAPLAGLGLALLGRAWLRRQGLLDLQGRVVAISGGSRGLGLALAEEVARQGARLAICARDPGPLEQARARLAALGADVLAVSCDVANRADAERFVQAALDRFGRVDVLVNNAGVITAGPLPTHTLADYEEAMGVMFWGVVYPTLAVLPGMRARREGRIVTITSIGGRVAVPHLLPYTSAKFAAVGFSEGLRAELARDGIRVTTVVPGLMRTGSHLNAAFKGHHRLEFALFSLLASLPLTAMDGRSAARQVVAALRRGDAECVLGWQAQLAMRLHGLMPGLTADLLGLVNRVLPGAGGIGQARASGHDSRSALSDSFLTALGERAARDINQYAPRRDWGPRAEPGRSPDREGGR